MFLGGRGYAHAAKFFGIVFAIEEVPLFAALEDFFLLRSNAFAGLEFSFFFLAERGGEDFDDLTTDGVAVVNKLDVIAGYQDVGELVGDADNFFAAKSHYFEGPLVPNKIPKKFLKLWREISGPSNYTMQRNAAARTSTQN